MSKETEHLITITVEEYEHLKNCERNLQEILMRQIESIKSIINDIARNV